MEVDGLKALMENAESTQKAGLEFTRDRKVLCVRVRRAATMLYVR